MRIRASMAVEAALLFPLILILVFSFIQVGLFLGLKSWTQSIVEETADAFQSGIRAGKDPNEMKEALERSLEKALEKSVFSKDGCRTELQISEEIWGPKMRILLALKYEFLFPQTVQTEFTAVSGSSRKLRDLMKLAEESAERVPEVKKWMEAYKEKMEAWAEKILG